MKKLIEFLLGSKREPVTEAQPTGPQHTKAPVTKSFGEFNARLPKQPSPREHRPRFVQNEAYENSPGVREALAAVDAGAPVVLVTGRAGTGKTTLIRYLRHRPGGEKQAVVAPTGLAAMNVGAQTIHSFFHFPSVFLDAKNLPAGRKFGVLYHRMTRLVIDEISMVRADLLDAMDARLREIRNNIRPFGGVQVVMVGDFLQLPPVVQQEHRPLLHALGYKSPFAFSAHVLQRTPVSIVSLEQVYRQEEKEFIELLRRIRIGESATEVVDILNTKCLGHHRAGVTPLLLTPTRAAADSYNQAGLAALPGEPIFFHAEITGKLEIEKDRLPVPEHLELRVGARVMTAKNDPQGRWINGSLGTVSRLEPKSAYVKFDRSDEEHPVVTATWEKVRQVWNTAENRIESEVIGAYMQLPLLPAWAITIHKAQGLTLNDIRIDLGHGAFESGQVYVALSRVRTIAGLSLARPLRPTDLKTNQMVVEFMEWLERQKS